MSFNRQNKFVRPVLIFFFVSYVVLSATPIKLTVRPRGTNQIDLTFGPVIQGNWYAVLVRTNGTEGHWITFAGDIGGSNKTMSITADLKGVEGLTRETLNHWKFVAGCWDDTAGDELPPLYKDLVLRGDPFAPADPYGDPMHDGWSNLEKLQDNKDPLRAYMPPGPANVDVGYYIDGSVRIRWRQNDPLPDYFLIDHAEQSMQPNTNLVRPRFAYRENSSRTNFALPPPNRPRFAPGHIEPPFITVTGPFREVARVQPRAGVNDYNWSQSNAYNPNLPLQPPYRVTAYFSATFHSTLDHVDADGIRKTMLIIAAHPATNGYNLIAFHPIPYAYYLLLVRDRNNPQWRASGYFSSGTNQNPIYLHVDKRGMMSDGQSPIAMPEVRFLSDVVQPEFVAGWGEDSDGDGLPDIYEVLVTHTEPDNADTGDTGILDGYKEMTSDGWSNLEKFRRRADPLRPAQMPATVELKRPTEQEILKAITPTTDLHYESQVEVRTNGAASYQPIEEIPWILYQRTHLHQLNERKDFDIRISWHFPEPKPGQYQNNRYLGP
jgi:hypothetical protein